MRNVLVTGANGFIGQALCKRMMADGYQVREAVRSAAQMTVLTSGKVNGEGTGERDERPTSNIERPTSNEKDEELATDPHRLTQTFVRATCSDKNSHRFAKEKVESRSAPYTETDEACPQDPYAVSKWEAEQVLRDVEADTGLEVVILRPPLVYGPGVKANFLRLFKIVERGIPLPFAKVDNRRSFIYLNNMIDAIITCINHPGAAGQTFLISDGEDVSTPELIRRIALALEKPARLFSILPFLMRLAGKLLGKSGAIDRLLGSLMIDSSKIRRKLGWKPPYTMKHGLKETAKWYKKSC